MSVRFYELGQIKEENIQFVVMQTRYKNQWVFGRHNARTTWEIPGGHIEEGETALEAAGRELREETGATSIKTLEPLFVYSFTQGEETTYGMMFYAEVEGLGQLECEIEEVMMSEALPEALTYKLIQPYIFEKTLEILKDRK